MGRGLAYLDSGAIIRYVETPTTLRKFVLDAIGDRESITSVLSITECLTAPLRDARTDLIADFEVFFSKQDLIVVRIEHVIAREAAEMRARYRLKTPDALHLATARVAADCEIFITADRGFERCRTSGGPEILIVPAV